MAQQSNQRSSQPIGIVQIRLNDPQTVDTRRSAQIEEDLMQEITIGLTRQRKQPATEPTPPLEVPETKSSYANLVRFFAQISLLAITIFIGMTFGALVCLAFTLFFCLPVAVHHWSEPDDTAGGSIRSSD